MDKKKDCRIPQCGNAPETSRERVVVGAKQLRKAVLSGKAKCVYLAENADPALIEPLEKLCSEHHIHITWVPSMAELGAGCGIEVGAAAAAVVSP